MINYVYTLKEDEIVNRTERVMFYKIFHFFEERYLNSLNIFLYVDTEKLPMVGIILEDFKESIDLYNREESIKELEELWE